jgi:hypothetical protein
MRWLRVEIKRVLVMYVKFRANLHERSKVDEDVTKGNTWTTTLYYMQHSQKSFYLDSHFG